MDNKNRHILISLVLIYFVCNFYLTKSYSEESYISNEAALQIAKKHLEDLGNDLSDMGVNIAKYYPPYNLLPHDDELDLNSGREFHPDEIKGMQAMKKAKDKIRNKIHWVVRYFYIPERPSPEPGYGVVGGSYSVFIDAKTGKILLVW